MEGVFPLEELQGNVSLCKGSKQQRAVANGQKYLFPTWSWLSLLMKLFAAQLPTSMEAGEGP